MQEQLQRVGMYGATKQINFNMKKTDVKLYGITYTVRATPDRDWETFLICFALDAFFLFYV